MVEADALLGAGGQPCGAAVGLAADGWLLADADGCLLVAPDYVSALAVVALLAHVVERVVVAVMEQVGSLADWLVVADGLVSHWRFLDMVPPDGLAWRVALPAVAGSGGGRLRDHYQRQWRR